MGTRFFIQWKSKANGRAGRGTKHFERAEGEELVRELNTEYPNIHHELVDSELIPQPNPVEAEAQSTNPDLAINADSAVTLLT